MKIERIQVEHRFLTLTTKIIFNRFIPIRTLISLNLTMYNYTYVERAKEYTNHAAWQPPDQNHKNKAQLFLCETVSSAADVAIVIATNQLRLCLQIKIFI